MHEDTFITIGAPATGLYKDKGSKFIALAHPADNEEKAREILAVVKKHHHDARHHCYAWVFGPDQSTYRYNDDGEPSGTAGRPIHGQILSAGLTDVVVVVVRYFGGTKLGVRGLINAYKGAAREALQQAAIVTRVIEVQFEILFEYPLMNEVMRLIKDFELEQREQEFGLSCRLVISVRKTLADQVRTAFVNLHGARIRKLETDDPGQKN
jgi:uncharacterized YigZ family protein